MFETASDFLKLEKIEYTGMKGKTLSTQTLQIFDEFNELYRTFVDLTYDSMDLKNAWHRGMNRDM